MAGGGCDADEGRKDVVFMSEVLTEFPAAVQIYGTECVAARAPKIWQSGASGRRRAPHLAVGDSGTIRAGRAGPEP